VVVAHCEGGQVGLVVEELIGQQQVVIKTLGERFEHVRGVSGAAILGDGRVGLILEIPGLATAHKEQTSTATRGRWLDHRVAVSSDAPGNEGDRGNARCSEADRLATTEEFAVPLRLDGG
jgi:chemotaxis protein histidine kinase CheA